MKNDLTRPVIFNENLDLGLNSGGGVNNTP